MRNLKTDCFFLAVAILLCASLLELAGSNPAPAKPSPPGSKHGSTATRDRMTESGKQAFAQSKCSACHITEGSGGCLGPPLDGVKARRSKEFIFARITNSEKEKKIFLQLSGGQSELMPHPRLPARQSEQIAAYLMTLPEPRGGFIPLAHKATKAKITQVRSPRYSAQVSQSQFLGKKLYIDHGCAACHSIGNVGGQFAPPLDGISKRRNRLSTADHISRGELQVSDMSGSNRPTRFMMPPAELTPEDIEHITDFLMSLPVHP